MHVHRYSANMREKARGLKRQAAVVDAEFRAVVIVFLNRVLGVQDCDSDECATTNGAASECWWSTDLPLGLKAQFHDALTPDEQDSNFDLRQYIDTVTLFKRIQQLTGIKLTKRAMKELKQDPESFLIVLSDIKKIAAKAKHMNIISLAEGEALSIRAMRHTSERGADRLFRLAMTKFEMAIRATPDNKVYNQSINQSINQPINHSHAPTSQAIQLTIMYLLIAMIVI
jgi:hypothetical protein